MSKANFESFLPLTLMGDSLYSMLEKQVLNKNYNDGKYGIKFQIFNNSLLNKQKLGLKDIQNTKINNVI